MWATKASKQSEWKNRSTFSMQKNHPCTHLCMVQGKPRMFLAILRDSKRVQFFYFGIWLVFLKSESKTRIELLFSDSMRLHVSLWYYKFVESESFAWLVSPKIENQTCLELHRVVSSCLGLPTWKNKNKIRGLVQVDDSFVCLSLILGVHFHNLKCAST